ncbi:MAG: bifunctional adenosylcobinamide kinase/adenosylcobinamide-phosphate guanylyltransferase [Prevotella sp.]|nr:bifunctional adenosylcobinamide kinase/adenosylcobinamide-phosphate guanylyltransferase [Prevotella sp.]
MRRIIMITGGQRSGKSRYAEQMAEQLSDCPIYMATARIWDDEFAQRVHRHQERRGDRWTTIEEEKWLSQHDVTGKVVLIDCLTLWCTNFFFDRQGDSEEYDVDALLKTMEDEFERFTRQDATFIFVTNEVGSGGVSENALQRRFTDLQGWLNQYVAGKADEVILMVSGIAVKIKYLPLAPSQGRGIVDEKRDEG